MAVKDGKLIPVALIFYDPAEDAIVFHFPTDVPKEEGIAILKKFNSYPKEEASART